MQKFPSPNDQGFSEQILRKRYHSVLKLFTGFATAALIA